MNRTGAVNILVVLALAALVFAVPGGGDTADLLLALLSTLILVSFVMLGWRLYRENRVELFSLGDVHRGLLYAGIAGIVFAFAGRAKLLDDGPGTLLWFLVVAGAIVAFYRVWTHWRAERAY